MLSAPIPENEQQRLKALRCYGILDSDVDPNLELLTVIAADICNCPVSLIVLVDENRQWFYANTGLEQLKETPRDISFCGHVVFHQETMIIPNALNDKRFNNNPLVHSEPPVKFYAGVPLINNDGYVLGTLCVIDHVPNKLSEKQISLLEKLRNVAVSTLEINYANKIRHIKDIEEKRVLYSSILNTNVLGIVLYNNKGQIIDCNDCFKSIWNISSEILSKNDPVIIKKHLKNQVAMSNQYVEHSEELSDLHSTESVDILYMKNGTVLEQHEHAFSPIDQSVTRVSLFRDITERHTLTEKLNYQATHDSLTGLTNRFEFERRLDRVLSRKKTDKSEYILCYMDLDNFKQVNDNYGHTSGDHLLQEISLLLTSLIRKRDTLARIGGDEFSILMEHCSIEQATRVANNLIKAINGANFNINGNSLNIGISIGIITLDTISTDKIEMLKKADAACYAAKKTGRNRIHIT